MQGAVASVRVLRTRRAAGAGTPWAEALSARAVLFCLLFTTSQKEKKSFRKCLSKSIRQPRESLCRSSTVAYLLHDFSEG